MSFCTKCGREILDESLGCPYCSVHENTQPGAIDTTPIQPEAAQNDTENKQPLQSMEPQSDMVQPEETVERVDSFTVEDNKGTYQRFENTAQSDQNTQNSGPWQQNNNTQNSGTWQQNNNAQNTQNTQNQYRPVVEQTIHPALKAVIIVLIVLVGGLGAVAGLVAGLILMKSPVEDYRSFGKLMTIVSAVMLGLSLICCVVMVGLNVAVPSLYYYY